MRNLAIVALACCLAGCLTPPPITPDKARCSGQIPEQLKDPVPGAKLPDLLPAPNAERNTEAYTLYVEYLADRWRVFGVAQTAAKDQEFEEKEVIIETHERCEEEDARAIKRAAPRFLGVF